ncbi:MAG TPA: hypothetical protein VGI87_02945 [Solirubrobacteraceae bacterium]
MELQGVARPEGFHSARGAALLAGLALLIALGLASPATAASGSSSLKGPVGRTIGNVTTVADPNAPVLVTAMDKPPAGFRLTPRQVKRLAAAVPKIVDEVHRHPNLKAYVYTKGPGQWQVSWFTPGPKGKELAQVYVDDATAKVTQAWTGFQVAWTMARGYPGAFGRRVNALYVWLPLCLVFILPFLALRRRGRWTFTLLHLDLLVLLGFSISLAFFNHGEIGLSIPLAYPFLLYLLVRCLLLAFGRGRPREPLRLLVPVSWLAIAVVFLVGFRVGLNVTNSNVIDVGYAGVIGADKLIHGQPLYGNYPQNNVHGDTYGPVNYYTYVPFKAIFGWSGNWDSLPAAHGAAIAFDLLTLVGLFFLGRMIRGPSMGIVLMYLWAAYPFTLYSLSSNSNDSLVAFLLVLALIAMRSAAGRGVAMALAGFAKFAPLILWPLLARGEDDRLRVRRVAVYTAAFAVTAAVVMLPVILDHNWAAFWHDSLKSQIDRTSPFSIWGLWGGLSLEQHVLEGLTVALAALAAFIPRRRTVVEVGAMGAAILIAFQICLTHWFYLYIPWFFPMLMVALIGAFPSDVGYALRVSEDDEGQASPAVAAAAA